MACFLVPTTEAIITTAVGKGMSKEHPFRGKVKWLGNMLWGGSACYLPAIRRASCGAICWRGRKRSQ